MNSWTTSLLGVVVAAALIGAAPANADVVTQPAGARGSALVEVAQCVNGATQSARSVTFDAQMVTTSLTAKMRMRIEVQRRLEGQSAFRVVTGPGLGVWSEAQTGVTVYKELRQVTDLRAPAAYRAVVTFVWLDSAGHVIRRVSKHTTSCVQAVS